MEATLGYLRPSWTHVGPFWTPWPLAPPPVQTLRLGAGTSGSRLSLASKLLGHVAPGASKELKGCPLVKHLPALRKTGDDVLDEDRRIERRQFFTLRVSSPAHLTTATHAKHADSR
eukprot:5757707-Pyramimonas_sp.AAC.1